MDTVEPAAASAPGARFVAIARRHEPRVWLLWAAGVAILLCTPFALVDPGLLRLALDPELVALIVVGSIALVRATTLNIAVRVVSASLSRPHGFPDRSSGRSGRAASSDRSRLSS